MRLLAILSLLRTKCSLLKERGLVSYRMLIGNYTAHMTALEAHAVGRFHPYSVRGGQHSSGGNYRQGGGSFCCPFYYSSLDTRSA